MASLEQCRAIVKQIIQKYAQYQPSVGEIEIEVVLDEVQDHYELIHTGWTGPYRVDGAVLHVDIRDGKVWIQHDGTQDGIAEELVEAGIPRTQIVLAFKHPDLRTHTDYAVIQCYNRAGRDRGVIEPMLETRLVQATERLEKPVAELTDEAIRAYLDDLASKNRYFVVL